MSYIRRKILIAGVTSVIVTGAFIALLSSTAASHPQRLVFHGLVVGPVPDETLMTVHVTDVEGAPAELIGCDVTVEIDPTTTEIGWVGDSGIRDGTRVRVMAKTAGDNACLVPLRALDINLDNSNARPLTSLEDPSQG